MFVMLDIAPGRLGLRAFGAAGAELDRIVVTKDRPRRPG